MMKRFCLITALLAFSAAGNTADKGKKMDPKADAKVAAGAMMKVDTKASVVKWIGTKKIGSAHNGQVAVKEGQIELKDGKIIAGNIVVDMATITNEDLKGSPDYHKKLIAHLSNEDFFNVTKFPTATFKITGAEKKSDTDWVIKGDFTMIGKTNPVEVPAKLKLDGASVVGEAKLKLDRTKWGLKYGSGNFFKELAGDKIINDEFELDLMLTAKQ